LEIIKFLILKITYYKEGVGSITDDVTEYTKDKEGKNVVVSMKNASFALDILITRRIADILNVMYNYMPSITDINSRPEVPDDCNIDEITEELEPLTHSVEVLKATRQCIDDVIELREKFPTEDE
jgi:hypothetical protein